MADTPRLNTGRSSEFADSAGSGGLALTFTDISYTGGVEGFTAIADVTGVTVSFVLGVTGPVQFFASGASLANPFIQGNYLGLAINVNGTDYYLNGTGVQGFNAVGGGNLVTGGFTGGNAISGALVLNLSAGSYTVKLRAFGNGYLESSANFPTKLVAVYPTITGSIATASPLTSQEAVNNSGTPTTITSTSFVVIPSTAMTVILNAPQTVLFMGYVTAGQADPAEDHMLGLRVDGIDYPGTSFDVAGAGEDSPLVVYRAIALGSGSHTADLVAKVTSTGTMTVKNSADLPSVLTAVYTVPQVVAPVPFAYMATAARTSGDVTGVSSTTLIDVPGPVEVTANTVGGDVLIEVSGYANGGSGNHIIGLGLKIDGVEQSDTPSAQLIGISPMGCLGATVNGFVGFKWLATGLTAGSHTFRLTHAVDGGSSAALRATAQRPLRMFVWYN